MKTSKVYPKLLPHIALSFLFSLITANVLIGMENPHEPDIEDVQQVTRYAGIPEFSELLATLYPNQLNAMRFVENCNILHLVAFRFKTAELNCLNEQYSIQFKPLPMARIQAIKADLLLKKGGSELLLHKDQFGDTPAIEAAATGNLHPFARLIIEEPADWLQAIQSMPVQHTYVVLNNFIEMMSIKHIYPKIKSGLGVELPLEELAELYLWAIETQEAIKENKAITNVLEKRNLREIKYLFDSYLSFDLFTQCREKPQDLQAQNLLSSDL